METVLVLNASYEPINTCTRKRAVRMVLKGTARVEESLQEWIRSSRFSIPVPVVIRLVQYYQVPNRVTTSPKRIFVRDQYRCQYCDKVFSPHRLTLDHVVPQSRGGSSDWSNLVTSCSTCNCRKGNRTPEEAGMPLLNPLRTFLFKIHVLKQISQGNQLWQKYLFNN